MNKQLTESGAVAAAVISVAVVYLSFLTRNYYWDGLEFAYAIENVNSLHASLIHPSHLFYTPFGYLVYRFVLAFGMEPRALTVLQVINCLLSVATASVLLFIVNSFLRSIYLSTVLAILFAFSATWWKFSTDADAYIPSIFLLTVCFYFLLPNRRPRPLLVAAIHILAMCFHQLAFFFTPVIVAGLAFQFADDPRGRLKTILKYLLCVGVSTFGIYYTSFWLQTGSLDIRQLMSWMTYYSTENGFVFDAGESVSRTLNGTVKLFYGGRFSFFTEFANPFTVTLAVLAIVLVIALFISIVYSFRNKAAVNRTPTRLHFSNSRIVTLCLMWMSVYLIFLFFWIPKNTFYRLFYIVPLIVLIGAWVSRSKVIRSNPAIPLLFVLITALSNFLLYIYPYSKVRQETPLFLATEMNKVWTPASVIFYATMDSDSRLTQYLNRETTWKELKQIKTEDLDARIETIYENGGEVWIEHSIYDQCMKNSEAADWLSRKTAGQPQYRIEDPSYNIRFVRLAR